MTSRSDSELLSKLTVDRTAFEQFYRRHVTALTHFASRRCKTPDDVADVVSRTFIAVLESADQFDARRGNARAWLFGIAAHEASAIQRQEVQQQVVGNRFASLSPPDDDEIALLQARIEAERLAPAISEALTAAPSSERELFLLVAYDDLTPSEAAVALGISATAARVRLFRVRRRLRLAAASPDTAPTTMENLA